MDKNRENTEFENYKIKNMIGKDDFGKVYKAEDKSTKEQRAIKFIEKETLKEIYRNQNLKEPTESDLKEYINCFKKEFENNKKCENNNNKNIVKYDKYYDNTDEFVIIMELCDENLLNYLTGKNWQITRYEKYEIICQLNHTLKIMNSNKLHLKDLKLKNILIKYENKEKNNYIVKLKLTDDNKEMAKIRKNLNSKDKIIDFLNAPEILNGNNYNEKNDLWSLGVIIYLLYFKEYPYKGDTEKELLDEINKGETILKSSNDLNLDDLIKKLLKKNINERLSWEQYFNHPFFTQTINCETYYSFNKNNDEIGKTDFANIYKAIYKENNEPRAIKIYRKDKIEIRFKQKYNKNPTEEDIKNYFNEFLKEVEYMKLIKGIRNDNVNSVKVYEYFLNNNDELSVVMELCDKNFRQFYEDRNQTFEIKKIYEILIHLNNSFKIMAEKRLVHRALNLDNIFIQFKTNDKNKFLVKLKMTEDCVFLKDLDKKKGFFTLNIKKEFLAPEILEEKDYNEKCDLWSLGVIIYYLYFKKYPIPGNSASGIVKNCNNIELQKSGDEIFDDLIKKLLNVNVDKRLTWEEYFNHPFFIPYGDYKKYYEIEKIIGETSNAMIYKAKEIKTQEYRAIKVYRKDTLKQIAYDKIKNEINHMKMLEGKNKENKHTVKIYENNFENETEIAIVMELCDNNLLDAFTDKIIIFNSDEIYNMLIQLNESFRIMNENKLIYCALNLQNILIKKEGINYIYKLKLTEDSNILNNIDIKGNIRDMPHFFAPEILKGKSINETVDLWSLGVIIYDLYFNEFPYPGDSEIKILDKIETNKELKKTNNKDLDDLIEQLLNKDPKKRLTWNKYFNHPFFKKNEKIDNYYELGDEIGNTPFAKVYKANIKGSSELRAIKIYEKNKIISYLKKILLRYPTDEDMKPFFDNIRKEINNMIIIEGKNKENNNTVKYYENFENKETFGIVMELCDENLLNFFTRLNAPMHPDKIYEILNQLNKSFKIMSDNKLVHKALNLENILVKYLDKEKQKYIIKLKLTEDSCVLNCNELTYPKIFENKNYIAPELINKSFYNEKCDLWSLGVIIYVLAFKEFPYKGQTEYEILKNIKAGQNFKTTSSNQLNDLIKHLLIENINERFNWTQYFNHPFFSRKK